MKTEHPVLIVSIEAADDLDRMYFVGFDGDYCAAGARALGVCNADAGEGEMAPIMNKGVALVVAGGAVDIGDPVTSDATGRAVPAADLAVAIPAGVTPVTSDAAQPTLSVFGGAPPVAINGWAMDAAAAEGAIIRVSLA